MKFSDNQRFAVCLLVILTIAGAAVPAFATDAPPAIEHIDQIYLTRQVRRFLTRRIRGEPIDKSLYVPTSLEFIVGRMSVTLRRSGKLIGTGDSDEKPVIEACLQAAEVALAAAQKAKNPIADDLADVSLELELIGPREPIGDGRDDPELMADKFEPAIEGISVRIQEKEILIRPSQLISMETYCRIDETDFDHRCDRYQIALENLHEKIGLRRIPPEKPPETVKIYRFRTRHWIEPTPGGDPIELIGGMTLVRSEAINPSLLTAVTEDLARFIRYRQTSDGFFSYEFLPGRDMYWPDEQNWVRQAATTWALAVYARERNDEAASKATIKALEAFSKMVQPVEGHAHARFLATPDRRHQLGATALLALACIDGPAGDKYADMAAELLNGLAAMQRDDGSFRTNFPTAQSADASQDYFPGEALLAVARQYVHTHDAKWREVCDRAFPYYVKYFRKNRPPMFVPWQAQAWGQLARITHLRRYADFVFEMSDFIVDTQLVSPEYPLSIYDGAFDVHRLGRGGISTAVYVEGLVEAARIARLMGEHERLDRYLTAIRRASRFVLQLQFRPEECFYVRSPTDVVGGMRNTPADPTLRIDHAQHALAALRGALELWSLASQPASQKE